MGVCEGRDEITRKKRTGKVKEVRKDKAEKKEEGRLDQLTEKKKEW